MKYNIGDEVRITNADDGTSNKVGDVGLITEVFTPLSSYRVLVAGGKNYGNWSHESSLEYVKIGKVKAGKLEVGDQFVWPEWSETDVFTVIDVIGQGNLYEGHVQARSLRYPTGLFQNEKVIKV